MADGAFGDLKSVYERDGFYFPLRALSTEDARGYRAALEAHEKDIGGPLQAAMRHQTHLLFTWCDQLIRHPKVLDAVEEVIGPNILCWVTNFFIKEPNTPDFVSWHQDATYWGLEPADQILTAWVALSDAPVASGSMKFLAGSHRDGQIAHTDTFHENNLLTRGQEIAVDVDEADATDVPLKAGEFSLHHVLLAHGSHPNTTDDRRIGLAIRYIPTSARQTKLRDAAVLVRGVDEYGHFDLLDGPKADLDDAAMAAHADSSDRLRRAVYSETDKTEFRP
ncbi:MAG: phytanoyl-CoA dioxygenase family protein [Pseudomonadota bacterium]